MKKYPVQIDKKVRAVIEVDVDASKEDIIKKVLDDEIVKSKIANRKVKEVEIIKNQIILIQFEEN
ncbi:hypothetical protein J6P52_00070 [bacterium]|nr:hypothetical protein [bacterium]